MRRSRGSQLVAKVRDGKQPRTTPLAQSCPPPVPEERAIASASPRRPLQVISPLNSQRTPLWRTAPPVAKRPRLDAPPAPPLPPGIPNLGNTCYLNSVLQALLNCPQFCNALRHACQALPTLAPDGLAHSLLTCVLDHAARRPGPLDPRPLRRALGAAAPQFQPCLQHDAHELFCALTNALQQEIVHAERNTFATYENKNSSKTTSSSAQASVTGSDVAPCAATTLDPVTRAFGFACDVTFTCVLCQTRSSVVEQHTHLSLEPLQQQACALRSWTVQGLMGAWFKQRASVWKTCEHCGGGSVAHRMQRRLRRLPRVLVVHINRFRMAPAGEGRWTYDKALDPIQVQPRLSLADHVAPGTWVLPLEAGPTPSGDPNPPRSPAVCHAMPRLSLGHVTPPLNATASLNAMPSLNASRCMGSPCTPPAVPSPTRRPPSRPVAASAPAPAALSRGGVDLTMDAVEAEQLRAALLASMQSLPPTWTDASPAADGANDAAAHPTAATSASSTVVLLHEPDQDASPAPTGVARKARFDLSSMVLHWGPAPSSGHYTCVARVDGATPWCLMNDATVLQLTEAQVGTDAHARNTYVLMFALDDHADDADAGQ